MDQIEASLADSAEATTKESISASAARAADALDVVIDVLEDIQKVISSGRPKKLRIRFGDKVVAEIPIALTAALAVGAGLAAVMLSKLTIEIEHET